MDPRLGEDPVCPTEADGKKCEVARTTCTTYGRKQGAGLPGQDPDPILCGPGRAKREIAGGTDEEPKARV